MSKINAAAPEPEIDAEWMKFMSRITRHQNCDTVDAENDSGDGDDSDDADTHNNAAMMTPRTHKNAAVSDGPGVKHRKSCISKKTQRRTYTFIDDDDAIAAAATDAPATAAATAATPATDDIRSRFTPIYISTKTKIAYLSRPVNIYDIFWKIPVHHYYKRRECVIKKQIKFQTTDPAAVASIKEKLEQQPRYYEEFVIEHIDNPTGRIPYKDQRKVSIGQCKKDLNGGNHKKKRAFFNCFVLILRINAGIAPPEERAPEDAATVLHLFYTTLDRIVTEHGGVVEQMVGDGLTAVWNGSSPCNQHAQKALQAAEVIWKEGVAQLPKVASRKTPPLDIGIGIETGPVMVGSFGPARRRVHTVMGEAVSVAARLEKLTSELGYPVLVGPQALAMSGMADVHKLGDFLLAGMRTPRTVYALKIEVDPSHLHLVSGLDAGFASEVSMIR
jgi:class 3 adenylate cyclase